MVIFEYLIVLFQPLIEVDIVTGSITRIMPAFDGCFRILDCRDSNFLILRTTPTCPGDIYILKCNSETTAEKVALPILLENSALLKLSDSIEYATMELNQQVSIVLTKPKHSSESLPLIIVPHGGPNSVYSIDYILYPNALAMLGYAVASSKPGTSISLFFNIVYFSQL